MEGVMKRLLGSLAVILVCSVPVQNAMAKTGVGLGLRSIGGDVGVVDPENASGALGFGAFADLGTVTPEIHLAPYMGYWSKSEGNPSEGEASISDIALGMRGKYMFHVSSSKFQPYAGAGLGFHFLTAKVTIPDMIIGGVLVPGMEVKDSSSKIGLDLGGGFLTPISTRTDFTCDLWYGWVEDVSQLSLKVGVAYKLGR
jgi:opacity protein-like surface antigen